MSEVPSYGFGYGSHKLETSKPMDPTRRRKNFCVLHLQETLSFSSQHLTLKAHESAKI